MERREGSNHTYPKSEISDAAKQALTSWVCQLPRRKRERAALLPAPPAARCIPTLHTPLVLPMPAVWPVWSQRTHPCSSPCPLAGLRVVGKCPPVMKERTDAL